ncbi:MAG: fibronectin type III domain-containing protein, partial [Chryseobacterium sp.]|nr:fibronectin type III domain-containing protein [Candidatus Chryseobacterium enterohippi]
MKKNYIGLNCHPEMAFDPKKNIFRCDSSKNLLPKQSSWITGVFAAVTLLLSGGNSFAQTNIASYKFEKSTGNAYVPITGGTKLFPSGTNTAYDSDVSSAITLPSPFTYGGVVVSTVYVSANGYITFGAAPVSTSNYTPLASLGTTTGAISAFAQDGASSTVTGAVPEVRYQDLGTEFVVQYQDHANYYNRSTERLNFQIRLVYATGEVKIIYGANTNPGSSTSQSAPQVGIRGNSVAFATNVSPLMIGNVLPGTTCDWSKAVTGNSENATMLFSSGTNVNVKIPAGLQYLWIPGTQLPVRTFAATTAVTTTGANLSWTAPTGATSYKVQYRPTSSCDWTNYSGNPISTPSVALTGLTQNTTYQVQVQATSATSPSVYSHIPNLAGTGSGYAAAGTFTTIANCASTVTGLASSLVGPDTATISWTASTTPPPNGYEYYYSTSSTAPISSTTASGSTGAGIITANLTNLTPATQYYYWVRTNCNGTDKGVWSTSSSSFTTPSLCPTVSAPAANATGVSLTPTITWTAISGATGYKVRIGTTSGANDVADADVVGGTSTSYIVPTPLAASTSYYFSVSGYTAATPASTTACTVRKFTTLCNSVPAPFAENFNSGALPGCWSNSSTNNTSYSLWQFTGVQDYGTTGNGATGTVAFVDASTPYAGVHDVTLVTPQINLAGLSTPYLQFKWFKNHSSSASSTVLPTYDNNKLTVQIKAVSGTTWETLFTSATNSTAWRTEGMNLPSTYTGQIVQVRFVVDKDVSGNGYFYDNLLLDDVELKEAPSCFMPSNLISGTATTTGATVTWVAPAQVPALGYDVFYNTTNTVPTATTVPQFTGVTTTSQAIPGVSGTTVYVWVRSKCSATAQSSWAGATSFLVPYAPPVNDNCTSPLPLTVGNTFASNAITATNVGSTSDGTPQSCQTSANNNVWFSVVVPSTGNMTIQTQAAAGSAYSDSVLNVFSGSCGSLVAVTNGCNDDNGVDNFSSVNITGQTPGATLLVSVWKWSNSSVVDGAFQISAFDANLATTEVSQVKNDLKVYPNPFADVLTISDITNVKSVSIIDIAGRLVKSIDNPSSQLQLSELKSGMYMVVLNMKDGSKQTIKA